MIENIRTLSRGEQGLSEMLELQNQALINVYPQVEPHIGRLITTVDQLRWVRPDDLEKMVLKPFQDRILFRLFTALGISPTALKRHFVDPKQETSPDYEEEKPVLFLSRNVLSKLQADNPLKRVQQAAITAVTIFEANLNLLPYPQDIPSTLRQEAARVFRADLDGTITSVALDTGEKFDADDLAVMESLMYNLIYSELPSYQPRIFSFGGSIRLVLANQPSAELMVQREAHKDVYNFLAKPVIEELFDLIVREGYAKSGVSVVFKEESKQSHQKGEKILQSLDLLDDKDAAFNQYVTSDLGRRIMTRV